jgi:hypothetical protein
MWSLLAGNVLSVDDIRHIDPQFIAMLEGIRDMSEDELALCSISPSISLSNGHSTRIVCEASVESANRVHFIRGALAARLTEFDWPARAIHAGLSSVIPRDVLGLYSMDELEKLVCGQRFLRLETLKSIAEYNRCDAAHPVVVWLWEILDEMQESDKVLFVRFVWGRARLPPERALKNQKFGVVLQPQLTDSSLPSSSTCFLVLRLPAYSSKKIMCEKLLYAVRNCISIDADHLFQLEHWRDAAVPPVERPIAAQAQAAGSLVAPFSLGSETAAEIELFLAARM